MPVAERSAVSAERRTGGQRPHHSLLFRLLASSLLIVVCAVSATAWLAVKGATGAVRQQQGQVLKDGTAIYRAMSSYAATHHSWDGVTPVVRDLARHTGLRIGLETQDATHRTVAAWPPGGMVHEDKAFAVIDALHVDPAQSPVADGSGIDPRALGPFRLPTADRQRLSAMADGIARCMTREHLAYVRSLSPAGRPRIVLAEAAGLQPRIDGTDSLDAKIADNCGLTRLDTPTAGERAALSALNALIGSCLVRQHLAPFHVGLDFLPSPTSPSSAFASSSARTATGGNCVQAARREQLTPYVAPAALLYVSDSEGAKLAGFDLSRSNSLRILGVIGTVLLLAVAVTVLNGMRLIGPLRVLTRAVRQGTDTPVRIRGRDEIGRLTVAFNELSAHRARTEQQRQAMVGDIAHELRTPVSTMRSVLEAGQDGVIPVDERLTASLLEETLLLQHIIDDLQDLAAADAGELRLHPEPVRARDILDHVAAVHRAAAEHGGATITVTAQEPLELSADPVRLRQIIGNLVSNAVRHTGAGAAIALNARREGASVVIEVADNGSGIAPEDLPYVFDRFWRAEKSRNRSTGGSGLGLSIARKLTEAHGGALTVTSSPSEGTVFTVRLP
jgi:two-component system sensor histidine kinase BaeS